MKSNFKVFALCAAVVLQLTACISNPTSPYQRAFDPGSMRFNYKVEVVDAYGKPVRGASVDWELTSNKISKETYSKVTDDFGVSTVAGYSAPKTSSTISWADYSNDAKFTVTKDGYLRRSGGMSETGYRSGSGSGREAKDQSQKVVLVRPIDYFEAGFAQSKQYSALRQKVTDFLSLIRLESFLNQADVKLFGIRVQEFKGRQYLTIELQSDNVFNNLKVDRYGVGKTVFDESVRKILNPLNDKISDPKAFYGYNIIVNTRIKNFSKDYEFGEPLKYEFMMPQASVRSYKEKNISGQKLIDESIVLLNDERIDLKFQ